MIQIDLRSNVPAYMQIIQQIQGMVLRGELRPGDQLPTVRRLAAELSINFNTIARAYRLLDQAGLITTQHGRGTYVLGDHSVLPEKLHLQLRAELLSELTAGFMGEAARLGSTREEVLEEVYRQIIDFKAKESDAVE